MDMLSVKAHSRDTFVSALSGGNQQKVILCPMDVHKSQGTHT